MTVIAVKTVLILWSLALFVIGIVDGFGESGTVAMGMVMYNVLV